MMKRKTLYMTISISLSLALAAGSAGCARTYTTLGPAEIARAFPMPPRTEVPASPDVVVERFAIIAAPPGRIYSVLADVERWPQWDPSVTTTRAYAKRPLAEGDRFFQNPGGYATNARVLDAEAGRLLRWRGSNDSGIVGIHSFRLVSIDD